MGAPARGLWASLGRAVGGRRGCGRHRNPLRRAAGAGLAAAPLRRGASLVRLGLARRFFDGEEFVGALVVMPGDDDIHRSRFRFGTACWRPFCCHLHEHGADREARVAELAAFWAERLAASPLGQPADPSISSEPADSDVDAGAAASQRSQRARLRIRRQQRQRRRRRLWRDLAPRMAMLEAGLQRMPPCGGGPVAADGAGQCQSSLGEDVGSSAGANQCLAATPLHGGGAAEQSTDGVGRDGS